jgi:polyribonucleotide nucleotidyltransferase
MLTRELTIGSQTLSFETGKLAKQADGSVVVRLGDTMVLVTACYAANAREGIDFLPLTVDYREYTYASGRIPGGFFKREGKPSEKEVLTSRVIDRPIRPLFPGGWRHETQVIALVLSADEKNDSDVLAITGASAALALSEIPFQKTIAGVRVGLVNGEYVINPTYEQRRQSRLDLVVAGSADGIVMVEAGAREVTEEQVVEALEAAPRGHQADRRDDRRHGARGRQAEARGEPEGDLPRLLPRGRGEGLVPLSEAMRIRGKLENYDRVDEVLEELIASLPEGEVERRVEAKSIFKELKEKVLRDEVLERGRAPRRAQVRRGAEHLVEVGVLPRVHGSAVFTRGETQALVTATLGTAEDQQKIETLDGEGYKRFMLHYNFPPFSVGEVAFLRGPGRREVGHGALAERALLPMVPERTVPLHHPHRVGHPRVERVVVDGQRVRRVDGDDGRRRAARGAGGRHRHGPHHGRGQWPLRRAVGHRGRRGPLRRHGLQGGRHGERDHRPADGHQGHRDHARGHARGAAQARTGPPVHPRQDGRDAGRTARNISTFAPRIITIKIPVDKIRDVIGPGGKTIRGIIERTGVKIDVEDDGRVNVASADEASAQRALQIIQELTATPELNKTYLGKVMRITDFGAFVEIMPGTDGLLHVSEIANHRVKDVRDELKEGEQLLVKVINIDPTGKIRLSRKALLTEAGDTAAPTEAVQGSGGGDRGGRGGRGTRTAGTDAGCPSQIARRTV